MLNGVDPIVIFSLKKIFGLPVADVPIPIVSSVVTYIDLPVIPLYLSENITGIFIDNESKSVEIETNFETLASGAPPEINQKGLSSTIKIEMMAHKDSVGLMVCSALSDIVFEKVTSKEYSVSYFHGPVAVLGGAIHSFNVAVENNTDLAKITLEITKGNTKPEAVVKVQVPKTPGNVLLNGTVSNG